jgi:hypothetical protein
MLQANLAAAYSKRIKGSVAENLEIAVGCNELALQVHTREAFPEEWAKPAKQSRHCLRRPN